MRLRTTLTMIAVTAVAAAAPHSAQAQNVDVSLVSDQLSNPVYVTAPGGDDRLFVVEQSGRIMIYDNGAVLPTPFLDIQDQISFGGEQGLLGLAFHPDYASNGRFFVNYTDTGGDTRIVEYGVSSDPNQAAPQTARELLWFPQPAGNHNGGWLGFGPDSYLYIATGDGGAANDRFGNGQNPDSLLAKILRIDVDNGDPYAIPSTNPWADGGGVPEAFIWGLRNPWRASFDENNLYIGDVGQGQWEEISVVSIADAGANLGWSIMEGAHCFQADECDRSGLVLPVYEYSHDEGCSVTGGYVYRGDAIPDLRGQYLFADYCTSFIRAFTYEDGEASNVVQLDVGDIGRVTSFGQDSAGEVYFTTPAGVYKIVPR